MRRLSPKLKPVSKMHLDIGSDVKCRGMRTKESLMHLSLLIAALTPVLLLGCASHQEAHETTQASTTGILLVRTGYVTEVRDVAVQDHSTHPSVPAIGALVGGVAGSLIGSGSGRAVAAIGGAAGGSIAGRELAKPGTTYLKKVSVRFEDGQLQTYDASTNDAFRVGEPVKVVNRNGNIELMR